MNTTATQAACSALNPERRFLLKHIGFDKPIVQASGHYYIDQQGRRYLDFLAQYGAVPFGHNAAPIWEAIREHGTQQHANLVQPLVSPIAEALAARLVALAPGAMRYATFVNSGAEAVEAAFKLARARTGRQHIVSTVRGFHGKTLGALSATDNPMYRAPFLLDTTCFDRIPFDDLPALEARLARGDVAAFIVEPVQGEGGMRVPSVGYLSQAAALCRTHGTLFVLDEIQTGLGRTGHLFAAESEPGLAPDIVLVAKALGGGIVPIGAMLCTEAAWDEAFGFFHSSTFANNGFTCAVGQRVLDLLTANDQAVVRHARAMGELLQQGLDELVARHPRAFAQRRGRGLMQALVLAPWRGECSYFTAHAGRKGYAVPMLAGYLLHTHGIVTAPVFNQNASLRLEPALTIEREEIEHLLRALDRAGRLISDEDFSALLDFVGGEEDLAQAPHQPQRPSVPQPAVRTPRAPTWQAPRPWEKRRGSFAFLIHPTDDQVLFDTLPADFGQLDGQRKAAWRDWMASWFKRMHEPEAVYHLPALRSRQGGYVEGWLIAAPLTPLQMMRLRKEEKAALLAGYIDVARSLNVDITGLGAFTSVIARGGVDLMHHGLHLTTGNSLTAIASVESLRTVAAARGRIFDTEVVAVIGAAGSIGRLAAIHAARHTQRLLLLGNPANPAGLDGLQAVAGEVYAKAAQLALLGGGHGLPRLLLDILGAAELVRLLEGIGDGEFRRMRLAVEERLAARGLRQAPIQVSLDLAADLPRAGVVLSASGAGKSFIDPRLLATDAVVCDVARPLDVLGTVRDSRSDVFVYEGGLMQLPENIAFGAQNVLGYPRGINLACLSETMVLAMEGTRRSHSIGNQIEYDEALSIYDKAVGHGFESAVLVDGKPWAARPARPLFERRVARPARPFAAASTATATAGAL
jgi:acetylornithine/succinyldiaminopimelate/putrescine aminotransferase/predicted amino acid dehydrogenase